MEETLVIGDLHFNDSPKGMLEAQKNAIISLCRKQSFNCGRVIFLGDLMMHRNPRPTVLLALKEMFDAVLNMGYIVYVLRGNHDSITKADDGLTSLSLFCDDDLHIINHTLFDVENEWAFIPHYEDENRIKKDLASVPDDYLVFGHFGYNGVLNSVGDADFSLSLSDFKNPTILGHIHKEGRNGNVTVLGTPYSTSFGEAGKDCYYGLLRGKELQKLPSLGGPRHLVVDYENVEDNLPFILGEHLDKEPSFTLLRMLVSSINEEESDITTLKNKLNIGHFEIKYKPLLDEKEEFLTGEAKFTTALSDDLIEHYINSSNTKISKDTLLEGLKIIYEDKRSRDQ